MFSSLTFEVEEIKTSINIRIIIFIVSICNTFFIVIIIIYFYFTATLQHYFLFDLFSNLYTCIH